MLWIFYLAGCIFVCNPSVMTAQKLPKNRPVRFLALGDSYTIGESVVEAQRWPEQLITELKKRGYTCHAPEIVAVTGWRTDDLAKALEKKDLSGDYTLVSLLIGVNNQYQGRSVDEYRVQFEALLKRAVAYAGDDKSRVFVMSIPDYGYTPFGRERQASISPAIDAFNAVNQNVTRQYGVTYIDITDISRRGLEDPELVAADGLHPSGKMYAQWVASVLRAIGL